MEMNFSHGGNVFAVARALGLQPADIHDFSASINPLGPAEGVREALTDAYGSIVHYPDSDCSALREKLANRHGISPENICVANGSTELIYLLPRLVEKKSALLISPSFSEYERALGRDNFDIDHLPLQHHDGFSLHPEQLEAALAKGFGLCILGNPGNPSGRLYPLDEVLRLYDLCRATGCLLVLDEAFMDFCEEASAKKSAAECAGIVLLRSMTKFFALPGLRLGYVIAAASMIARISALREPWSVNTPAQAAGLASLAAAGYDESTRKLISLERERLTRELAAIPGLKPFPSAANFLLLEIRNGLTSREVAGRLISDHRILVRDCSNFPGLDSSFIRVAVRGSEENGLLISALASTVV